MLVTLDRTKRRSSKLANDLDNEDASDGKRTNSALNQVDLRIYLDSGAEMEIEEVSKIINETIHLLRPEELNARKETVTIWEECIVNLSGKFPCVPSREKPQDFSKSTNNVNKFFGNKFGNVLRSYVNNLGVYFAGE